MSPLEKRERKVQREADEKARAERIKRNGGYFRWTETEKEYRGVWVSLEEDE